MKPLCKLTAVDHHCAIFREVLERLEAGSRQWLSPSDLSCQRRYGLHGLAATRDGSLELRFVAFTGVRAAQIVEARRPIAVEGESM